MQTGGVDRVSTAGCHSEHVPCDRSFNADDNPTGPRRACPHVTEEETGAGRSGGPLGSAERDGAGTGPEPPPLPAGPAAGGSRPVGRTRVLGAGSGLPLERQGRALPMSPGRNRPSLSVTPLLALPSSAPGRRLAGGLHRLPTPLLGCAARTGPHDGCATVPSPPGCVSLPCPRFRFKPKPRPHSRPLAVRAGPLGASASPRSPEEVTPGPQRASSFTPLCWSLRVRNGPSPASTCRGGETPTPGLAAG